MGIGTEEFIFLQGVKAHLPHHLNYKFVVRLFNPVYYYTNRNSANAKSPY